MNMTDAGGKLYEGKVLEGEISTSELFIRLREMRAFRESRPGKVKRNAISFFAAVACALLAFFLLESLPMYGYPLLTASVVWAVLSGRAWYVNRQPLDFRAEQFLEPFCTALADDLENRRLYLKANLQLPADKDFLVSTGPKCEKGIYKNCVDRTYVRQLLRVNGRLRDGSRIAVAVRERVLERTLKGWKKSSSGKYKRKVKVQKRLTTMVKMAVAVPAKWQTGDVSPNLPADCRALAVTRNGRSTLLVSFREKTGDLNSCAGNRTLELLQIIHGAFAEARTSGKGAKQ